MRLTTGERAYLNKDKPFPEGKTFDFSFEAEHVRLAQNEVREFIHRCLGWLIIA